MKNNYKMIIAYDGTRYYGWEHQPNTDMTIQGKLESVLSQVQEELMQESTPKEWQPMHICRQV